MSDDVVLSKWIPEPDYEWCYMRIIAGTDPKDIANRIAFIEKTPRIRIAPYTTYDEEQGKWLQGPKGEAPEYGQYQPSRDWCDQQLLARGYILEED